MSVRFWVRDGARELQNSLRFKDRLLPCSVACFRHDSNGNSDDEDLF